MTLAVSNTSRANWVEINHAVAKVRNSLLLATPCTSPSSALTLSQFKDPRADARTSLLNTIMSSNQGNLFFSKKDLEELESAGVSKNFLPNEEKIPNSSEKQEIIERCLNKVEDFILKNEMINQVLDNHINFSREAIEELLNDFPNKKIDTLFNEIEKSIKPDSQSDTFIVKQENGLISIPQVANHCYLASSTQALLHCIDTHKTSFEQIDALPEDLKDLYQEVKSVGIKSKSSIDDKMVKLAVKLLKEYIDQTDQLDHEKNEFLKVYDLLKCGNKSEYSTAEPLAIVFRNFLNNIPFLNSIFELEPGKNNCPKDNNFDYCLFHVPKADDKVKDEKQSLIENHGYIVQLKDQTLNLFLGHYYSIIKNNDSFILYNSLDDSHNALNQDDFARLIDAEYCTSIFITSKPKQ
ncbi:MAG: hypothetical protein V4629_07485 [Pseudomonadota bacterium]